MEQCPASGADVDETGSGVQAGVFFAVDCCAHAFRLSTKRCVVAVLFQMEHLVLQGIVDVVGEMCVIGARQSDNAPGFVTGAGDSHAR